MTTYVALLRGIRTYIQSGNVVYNAPEGLAKGLAAAAHKIILAKFGFSVPISMRSLPDMGRIAASNPFLKRGVERLF